MAVNVVEAKVKYRRPLNSQQLAVLKLLYRFRFGTVEYIAEYLDKTNLKVVQKKLKILEDQGYIAKRYDKTYKLQGKPAEYYLTPKGGRLLKSKTEDNDHISEQGLKNLYKNPSVSADFIAHCLTILRVALHLERMYGANLHSFARTELIPFDYFPTWKPDLYLSYKTTPKSKSNPFFLDIWDGTRPFFVSVRKARSYITYEDSGDWITDQLEFPIILVVCDNKKNETKLRRQIRKAREENYTDTKFATTTIDELLSAEYNKAKLWTTVTDYKEEDKTCTLTNLRKSLEQ